ncbi:MAG TPA: bifunctional hydroxymethylpyrimidine kinase/phosphomethylpyrimidine kinase [Euryarchaeota archaeon]|nr:bifunctional hydroxymethylpyrimidine kinase/phosphomethylpyrimidine kinase [Euryarchaeota archaeon]
MKTALTIAGSDSIGGAGIQADLKAFASIGVHGCSAIACITAQNTSGIRRTIPVPIDMLRDQIEAVLEDAELGAVKTGAIYTAENCGLVADLFGGRGVPLVVDPVLVSTTGDSLSAEDLVSVLKKRLIPVCSLVTPNLSEARVLSGIEITDMDSLHRASEWLLSLGASGVLIKGLRQGERISDLLTMSDGTSRTFTSQLLRGGEFHGTGCILSALTAGYLALGNDLCTSVTKARGSLFEGMTRAYAPGKGMRIIDTVGVKLVDGEKAEILHRMVSLRHEIETRVDTRLLPEVGSNLGHSISAPEVEADVAGFTGRIVREGGRTRIAGCPQFGASKHIARIIISASRFDPGIRSAMNIKYDERNLRACTEAGLSASDFSRENEPPDVSSMDWGVARAIEQFGSVPDVIWDAGGPGKEPMIRVLGHDPSDVLDKVSRIARKLPGE